MKLSNKTLNSLKEKLDDNERIGFIVQQSKSLKVIETNNISPEPNDNFIFDPDDLKSYVFSDKHKTVATWHTHPNSDANLCANDYVGLLNYPELKPIIVSKDEIRIYEVIDGAIFQQTAH